LETLDQAFNSWMQPAGVTNSPEVVSARKSVALDLRDADVDAHDLVLAAFGEVKEALRETVELRIQERDPTHTPGKRNLVRLICASAVMSAMERADDLAVDLALLAGSALFRGMKPGIKSLPDAVAEVSGIAALRSRKRLAPKKASSRVQAATSPENVDAATVNALASRLEQAISHFDSQLQILNEEVDVLWWARTGRSASGEPWVDLPALERAVQATAEVSRLVVDLPATGAVFEVLRGVAVGPKKKTEDFSEICRVASAQDQLPSIDSSRWLLPVLSGVRIARMYPAEARAGVTSTELGLDSNLNFNIIDVPEQLLRELAIVQRVT